MICSKCGFESDNSARCPKCGHRIALELAAEKFGRAAVHWFFNWFFKAWFWIRTVLIGGAAILIYDRVTGPFEVVAISVGLLIYSRVANLELHHQWTSGVVTAQLQFLVSAAQGEPFPGAKDDYTRAVTELSKEAKLWWFWNLPIWLIQLLAVWELAKTFLTR